MSYYRTGASRRTETAYKAQYSGRVSSRGQPHDHPGHLMPGYPRVLNSRVRSLLGERIAVADAARLHPDPYRSGARLRYLPFYDLEGPVRAGDLHHAHRRHASSSLVPSSEVHPQSGCIRRPNARDRKGLISGSAISAGCRTWWNKDEAFNPVAIGLLRGRARGSSSIEAAGEGQWPRADAHPAGGSSHRQGARLRARMSDGSVSAYS
jgi:hypothetical protein